MPRPFTSRLQSGPPRLGKRQSGLSLIVVLLILVVVSILGVASIQISVLGERATRNDRDIQIAWQGAEAGLLDAQIDIMGSSALANPATAGTTPSVAQLRAPIFKRGQTDTLQFQPGCGNSAVTLGLCSSSVGAAFPDWLTVDFTDTSSSAHTVEFGTFTGRSFSAGSTGLQPAFRPRYVIELVDEPADVNTKAVQNRKYLYRVTSMGTGPNANTRAVVQMIFRN